MSTIQTLRDTIAILNEPPFPRAVQAWGGAGVGICEQEPEPSNPDSFRSEPRWVVTSRALELSWLFERLRDAFYAEERLDGCSKIEFFGRLANAANRCIEQGHGDDAAALCRAALHEAFAMYDEMEGGRFGSLSIASPGEIVDDSVVDKERAGYVSYENTLEYFKHQGLRGPDS